MSFQPLWISSFGQVNLSYATKIKVNRYAKSRVTNRDLDSLGY